ncbi:MAG: hypothetical protein KKC19_02110 [Nanoarchaeota archaeon]|nr:hypothetical protein [Nanoarchaeota archaeon]
MNKKNKKGWIKVTEAVVAILLISTVLLIVIKKENPLEDTTDIEIYNIQKAILREIQITDALRAEIIGTSGEIEWENLMTETPQTKDKIQGRTPANFDCVAKICSPSDTCILPDGVAPENPSGENIYVEKVMITTNLITYNPRVLKLFCWEK